MHPPFLPLLLPVLVVGLATLLGACGHDEQPRQDARTGDAGTRPAPEELLRRLVDRVARGEGISDETWTRDVQEVAMALWPDDRQMMATHTDLAHIAGDMAAQLLAGKDARADWLARDPNGVEIHDQFVAHAKKGPAGYRQWVEGDGRKLLEERYEALASGVRPN